jgi:hypothetical protein
MYGEQKCLTVGYTPNNEELRVMVHDAYRQKGYNDRCLELRGLRPLGFVCVWNKNKYFSLCLNFGGYSGIAREKVVIRCSEYPTSVCSVIVSG